MSSIFTKEELTWIVTHYLNSVSGYWKKFLWVKISLKKSAFQMKSGLFSTNLPILRMTELGALKIHMITVNAKNKGNQKSCVGQDFAMGSSYHWSGLPMTMTTQCLSTKSAIWRWFRKKSYHLSRENHTSITFGGCKMVHLVTQQKL